MKCPSCGYYYSTQVSDCIVCEHNFFDASSNKKKSRINKRSLSNKKSHDKEIEMMQKLWLERPHISEVSGEYLGEEFEVSFFAHVLGKGAYPSLRTNPKNIVIMTFDEHYMLDHQTHRAKEDPRFDFVFKLKESLIKDYYKK